MYYLLKSDKIREKRLKNVKRLVHFALDYAKYI